jgi:hypothetical protein
MEDDNSQIDAGGEHRRRAPARMPAAYIAKAPVPLSRLPVGETGYIHFTDVRVDRKDLSTYAISSAPLREKMFSTVAVRHDEDGHRLVLRFADMHFGTHEIEDSTADLIPVIEILEQLEPDPFDEIRRSSQRTAELLDGLAAKSTKPKAPAFIAEPKQRGAVMPGTGIRPPEESLSDLKLDDAAYLDFTSVLVDERDGSIYIKTDARLYRKRNPLTVAVTLRADGYHLTLQSAVVDFSPREIADYSRVVPAVEVTDRRTGG